VPKNLDSLSELKQGELPQHSDDEVSARRGFEQDSVRGFDSEIELNRQSTESLLNRRKA
jgi:hypothetical protein